MKRRVVITGAGVITPIGVDVREFWRQCLAARSIIRPIPEAWERYASFQSRLWSPLPAIDAEALGISRPEQLSIDPVTILALGASREALAQAGLALTASSDSARTYHVAGIDPAAAGVYLGTGVGGAYTFLHNHAYHLLQPIQAALARSAKTHTACDAVLKDMRDWLVHGRRYHPFVVSMLMPNAPAAALGIKYAFTGPNLTYSVACAAGTVAIGRAYRDIRAGNVDVALSGGCEHLNDEHGHIFRGFDVAGTLVRECADPETANRPFDQKRSGFLFSQGGAAILVLEELEHAKQRGAQVIAEVIGYGESFDAHSMMALAPGGEQIERMLRKTLADAEVDASEVDYVNAHGTGTENNDRTEAEVIERVFGDGVHVNATKSLLGHAIGASGAIEAVVTALSLREGTTHVCRNLERPVRPLNFVSRVEKLDLRVGVSQSFAFGGHNAALVMRRYDG